MSVLLSTPFSTQALAECARLVRLVAFFDGALLGDNPGDPAMTPLASREDRGPQHLAPASCCRRLGRRHTVLSRLRRVDMSELDRAERGVLGWIDRDMTDAPRSRN